MDGAASPEAPKGCGPLIAPPPGGARSVRLQIFERIRAAGALSRARIAKELGVSPATVTTQTAELLAAGLVEEVTASLPDEGGRGRPPVALGVRAGAHAVAGVRLSDRLHTAVVLDFAGRELGSASAPSDGRASCAVTLDAAARLIDAACAEAGIARADLSRIGLGLPGVVAAATGRVHWSPLLTEEGIDLPARASAHLGVPVRAGNDASLVALAEQWFGQGRELATFAVVTIEYGVGLGVVVDHRLAHGAQGLGTELGHTKVQLDGALCRCGQRGCLEAYVADYALAREAPAALGQFDATGAVSDQLEVLHARAKAGDAAAHAIFRRAGRYLALGIANVVNLYDPELILLSGERMRYDMLYAPDMTAEIGAMAIRSETGMPRIEVHAWGPLMWAYGAAALALADLSEEAAG